MANNRMLLALALAAALSIAATAQQAKPLQVAVVTGGHDFDKRPFKDMLKHLDGMACALLEQKDDAEFLEDISSWDYDVVVLYNMSKKITDKRKQNFLKLLDKGVGIVVLHHAVANFPDWPEYADIIGAHYYLDDTPPHGRSQYKHDVTIPVAIANPDHPVTRGVQPFELVDEVYSNYDFLPGSEVLLTTTQPDSAKVLAHAKTTKNSRLVYIQLGHGPQAFSDKNYLQLLHNAILWTAKQTN